MRFTTTATSLTIAVIHDRRDRSGRCAGSSARLRTLQLLRCRQVLGCALRYETYYSETVRRAAEAGRTLPSNYQLNLIAGLDVAALRDDAHQALVAQSSPESPIEEVIAAVSEIALAEYDGASAGAPGYHEAWAQVAACSTMFGQFGLFAAYQ